MSIKKLAHEFVSGPAGPESLQARCQKALAPLIIIFIPANFEDRFSLDYVLVSKLLSQRSIGLTELSDHPDLQPSEPRSDPRDYRVGYGRPPKHAQYPKGKSGNPAGRPKAPVGISIKEILDGDQRGKNGEVISRRDAYVIALVNEALTGNQKAFSKFMQLMHRSGLMRREVSRNPSVVSVPMRTTTTEEFERDFGRPSKGAESTNEGGN